MSETLWRKKNPVCERSGRGKANIMRILAAAKVLPRNTVTKHKFGGGRRRKTSRITDTLMKRELQKILMALDLQTLHPNLLKNVTISTVQDRLQKDLDLPGRKAVKNPLLTERMKKQCLAFTNMYAYWTTEEWKKVMFSNESNC